jgi:flagellar basal-body rod protein FlgB
MSSTGKRCSVQPVNLFNLASRHSEWLSFRQSVVAGNIANSETPGFKARDAVAFEGALDKAGMALRATHARHIGASADGAQTLEAREVATWETSHSGNSVRLEQELMRASEVNRGMQFNTSVVQAFHRMLASSVRS